MTAVIRRAFAALCLGLLAANGARACDVDAKLDADLKLQILYDCPAGTQGLVLHESRAARFVRAPVLADGTPLAGTGEEWRVPADRPARFGYRLDLAALANEANNIGTAMRVGGSLLTLLPSWLMEPRRAEGEVNLRIAVTTSPGQDFAAGLPFVDGRYTVRGGDVWAAGYTVFGKLARDRIALPYPPERGGKAVLEVVRLDGAFALPAPDILRWIEDSANQVAGYFGGFPARHAMLAVVPASGAKVRFGRVVAGGGPSILLQLGTDSTREALHDDWVLIHELSHVAGPFLADRGGWFMEGMATYVEPIIRARAGWRTPESVWREYRGGMARGGMYWGGASFMLMADLEIRRRSEGRRGLEDCLADVLWRHGNATLRWRTDQMIAACDAATGFPVMAELDARYRRGAAPFDLEKLWADLGVESDGTLRMDAPLARYRDAITRPRPG